MTIPVVDLRQTGCTIQELREARGISVKDLQTQLGFATPQAIYKWQQGVTLPTVPMAYHETLYSHLSRSLQHGESMPISMGFLGLLGTAGEGYGSSYR